MFRKPINFVLSYAFQISLTIGHLGCFWHLSTIGVCFIEQRFGKVQLKPSLERLGIKSWLCHFLGYRSCHLEWNELGQDILTSETHENSNICLSNHCKD